MRDKSHTDLTLFSFSVNSIICLHADGVRVSVAKVPFLTNLSSSFNALVEKQDVLFAASLFAVLKPLLYKLGYPVDFYIAIYGRSCSMKTTLGHLFFTAETEQTLSFVDCAKKQLRLTLSRYVGHAVLLDNYHKANYQENKKQLSRLTFVSHDIKCTRTCPCCNNWRVFGRLLFSARSYDSGSFGPSCGGWMKRINEQRMTVFVSHIRRFLMQYEIRISSDEWRVSVIKQTLSILIAYGRIIMYEKISILGMEHEQWLSFAKPESEVQMLELSVV